MTDKILLNIGGTKFYTRRATLENSQWFSEMIDRRYPLEFFVDRDGTHFRHILNYLRDKTVPDLYPPERKQLLVEARYYNITGLVRELEAQSSAQGMGGRGKKTTKRRRRHYK
jgi:hypothetical protein